MEIRRRKLCFVVLIGIFLLVPLAARAETATFQLSPGWNLIAMPLVPSDTSIAHFLAPAGSDVVAWSYTDTGWQWFRGDSTNGTLTTVAFGRAYWVKTSAGVTLTITGTAGAGNVNLMEGWNFAGFFGGEPMAVAKALAALGDKYSVIWSYFNDRWWLYKRGDPQASTITELVPGRGYWVKIDQYKGAAQWGPDTSVPTIGFVSPFNGEVNIDPEQPVTVTFSEDVDPMTVTKANFSVATGTTELAGALALNGNVITFTPST